MAPQSSDVTRLLTEAARATSYTEQERLVAEAEQLRTQISVHAAREREVDLGNAVVLDHLTPVRVHEHHTAATDWLGGIDTSGGEGFEQEVVAQASLWYGRTAAIRPWREEFDEQARGQARKLAGAFGEQAAPAEQAFLDHVAGLYDRELAAGLIVQAESGLPQVGDPGNPVRGGTVGPMGATGLPLEETTSERAPMIQAMEDNSSSGIHDALGPNNAEADNTGQDRRTAAAWGPGAYEEAGTGYQAPGRMMSGPHQVIADEHDPDAVGPRNDPDGGWHHRAGDIVHVESVGTFGDENGTTWAMVRHPQSRGDASFMNPNNLKKINGRNASMQTAPCPSCRGRGRVAVRTQAASGLPQIQEVVDSNNQPHSEQQPDWSVAFPWEMPPDSSQAINEAESQIAQREKLKGASRQQRAEAAYRRIMAGQDDSGWLGDMGAGGVGPGEQDGGNPGPPDSLGYTDPVYGQGGDQGDRALKGYGADEADDYTNNPGMDYQPGQPTQYDQGGRGNQVGSPTASRIENDPEVQRARRYLRQRISFLEGQG